MLMEFYPIVEKVDHGRFQLTAFATTTKGGNLLRGRRSVLSLILYAISCGTLKIFWPSGRSQGTGGLLFSAKPTKQKLVRLT